MVLPAKCSLMHKFEGNIEPAEIIHGYCTFIADGMAFVRQTKTANIAFRVLAGKSYVFSFARSVGQDVRRSHGEIVLKQIAPPAPIKQLLSTEDYN